MTKELQEKHWDRWFRRTQNEFAEVVMPFAGKPVQYVEIGCWAGASAEFMCRNVLTDPESSGIGIDPYPVETRHDANEIKLVIERARSRVQATGVNWEWMRESSATALRDLYGAHDNSAAPVMNGKRMIETIRIDILYIDGDHDGHAVVQDFVLAWPMLRAGSLVIFDDYRRKKRSRRPHVKEGVEAIRMAWGDLLKSVGRADQQRAFIVQRSATYAAQHGLEAAS